VAAGIVWTPDTRTLRHTIGVRTGLGTEEEIRLAFGKIGGLARAGAPELSGGCTVAVGAWVRKRREV
jgi:thymidylate synthase (FAD)